MNAEDARRFLSELPSGDVGTIFEIAANLDKDGPPVSGGVPIALLIDVLQMHEVDTWPRTGRQGPVHTSPFVAFAQVPRDGRTYRSFALEDLKPEDAPGLREFTTQSRNPFVRARVSHVLWTRWKDFVDARAAHEARFEMAERLLDGESWPPIVSNLGHLMGLLVQANAKDRMQALMDLLDRTASKLEGGDKTFAFPVLADVVNNTILNKKTGREAFSKQRADQWALELERIAGRYRHDAHHGHDALVVLEGWHAKWGEADKALSVRRDVVEQLLECADRDRRVSSWTIQRALQSALDYGISDLSERCRLQLMKSIKESVANFKALSGRFQVPPEALEQLDAIIVAAQDSALAIRQIAVLPGLLEIDRERIDVETRKMLAENPLSLFFNSAHYHREGKVTFQANDPEGNVQRQVATNVGFHLVMIEAVLQHALDRLFPLLTSRTLVDALANWPHLAESRGALLSVAAERFAGQDWVSSGYLVATLYEAVLRDLLRAAGYSALKIEPGGVQMDETLNSLLRARLVRDLLGEKHCDLVEFVLCDRAFGWNMRNEIAHGTIRPDALAPTRVFMAWLLLIRLTSYIAQSGEAASQGPPPTASTEPGAQPQ
ncbi:DUF4209 domain-containing protein [Sorangium sp. So ce1014]|uniref:DUF4209 domain-containing protein n=1 Tax=Sorangium sp. So ce1014 TaxID=3133326 RepID=UPI003F5E5CD5